MKIKTIRTISALLVFAAFQNFAYAQGNTNIEVRFLNAAFTNTTAGKDLVAVFLVSTKDTASFPPVIIFPIKCTVFENGREIVVMLQPQNLSASLYGANVAEKNKDVYALVKDKVDLNAMQTAMIIAYGISDLNYEFKKMSLSPVFKEKRNQAIRIEKRMEFEVH